MPSKGLIHELQDTKGGIGSISRRSFDPKSFLFQRRWSHNAFYHGSSRKAEGLQCKEEEKEEEAQEDQRCWGNMPPDLLRDIIQRVEDSASVWPSRKDVVSCAAVSKAWREVTIDLVKPPELSGKFTFPISVKQVSLFLLFSFLFSFFILHLFLLIFYCLLLIFQWNHIYLHVRDGLLRLILFISFRFLPFLSREFAILTSMFGIILLSLTCSEVHLFLG